MIRSRSFVGATLSAVALGCEHREKRRKTCPQQQHRQQQLE